MDLPQTITHPNPTVLDAHNICLRAEKHFRSQLATTTSTSQRAIIEKQLVNVRIVGHLLSAGPTDTARQHIANLLTDSRTSEVASEHDYSQLVELGDFFDKHFIRLCKLLFHPTAGYIDSFVAP